MIVAIYYATEWVEAKPVARIREKEIIELFIKFVVLRFGVPVMVVTNNGTQFVGNFFESMLQELSIKHLKASVTYPQCNEQVEVNNMTLLQGLKKACARYPEVLGR